MPISEFIDQFRPTRVRARLGRKWMYVLTPEGKQKVNEDSGGGANWQVLAYLDDEAPCTIREISQGTHMDEGRTKQVISKLVDSHYVRHIEKD